MLALAPYAVSGFNSRGRQHPIALAKDRDEFQRDYTRILHSRAFRRLQGKTQVFPAEQGDWSLSYRTRMSHSFEVEQISRSVARALAVNQDLCAALAIGHDIGHAAFGHTGQDVLDELFKDIGGFEHNHQALRLVDELESPYPDRRGLNLMFETREGLLKHCTAPRARRLGTVAARHLTGASPPLEVQIVDSSDRLAYLYGDLEDAFDQGIVSPELLLEEMPGFRATWDTVAKDFQARLPTAAELSDPARVEGARALVSEVWRRMLSDAIQDLVFSSRAALEREDVSSLDEVRATSPLVGLSAECNALHRELRWFSRRWIYENAKVLEGRARQRQALAAVVDDMAQHPAAWHLAPNPSRQSVLDAAALLTDRAVLGWFHAKA